MKERCELASYPSLLLDVPARAHCARCSGSASGAWCAPAGSPWPAPFPPSPPTATSPGIVRELLQVLWGCPTSLVRSSSATSLDFPMRPRAPSPTGQTRDLPVPAQGVSVRAQGLGPRGAQVALANARPPCCLPLPTTPSAPRSDGFRGSIPGPHVPLSTLRPRPCGRDSA